MGFEVPFTQVGWPCLNLAIVTVLVSQTHPPMWVSTLPYLMYPHGHLSSVSSLPVSHCPHGHDLWAQCLLSGMFRLFRFKAWLL